jgi:hypothetical protein
MPTTKIRIRRPRPARLTGDAEMDLWLGYDPSRPLPFASDEERRALWFRHRERLMQWFGGHGKRPLAWWRYEAPDLGLEFPGIALERSTLWEAGLLAENEKVELETFWRKQFDRAQAPNFFHPLAPGQTLEGGDAREALYSWADIPRDLVRRWAAAERADV